MRGDLVAKVMQSLGCGQELRLEGLLDANHDATAIGRNTEPCRYQ